jgi:hypothetical protein
MTRFLPALLVPALLLAGCRDRQVVTDDQSTPQATVSSLVHELERLNRPDPLDVRQFERFFVVHTPAQQQYVSAWIALIESGRELQEQTRSRFGREDARQALGPARPGEDHIRRFNEPGVVETIEEDRARLVSTGGQVLVFQREGADWKIVPGGEANDEAELAEATRILRGLATLLAEVAEAIQTRQVETAAEARQAIAEHLTAVALGS